MVCAGQWERVGAKTQGLGKGIHNPHLLLKCKKENPCGWQICDRRDQASSYCFRTCGLQPDEICSRHVRVVSHAARLTTCTHGRRDYSGQVADRSDVPFPACPSQTAAIRQRWRRRRPRRRTWMDDGTCSMNGPGRCAVPKHLTPLSTLGGVRQGIDQ